MLGVHSRFILLILVFVVIHSVKISFFFIIFDNNLFIYNDAIGKIMFKGRLF